MEAAATADSLDVSAFLDVGSVVDYVLVSEVAKNADAYRISTYVHRPAAGAPLHAGLLWDSNIAFGNADYGAAASRAPPSRLWGSPEPRRGVAVVTGGPGAILSRPIVRAPRPGVPRHGRGTARRRSQPTGSPG